MSIGNFIEPAAWQEWFSGLSASYNLAWAAPLAIFALASLAAWLVLRHVVRSPDSLDGRMAHLWPDPGQTSNQAEKVISPDLRDALAAQIPESAKEKRQFHKLLRSAGIYDPHAASWIYAARFLLLAVPLVVSGIFAVLADRDATYRILLTGGIVAAGLSVGPRFYVWLRRAKRRRAIRRGLPDTLDMLSMCVGGGLPLSPSLAYVSTHLPQYPELAQELLILRRQAEIGSLRQALADFAARVELPEIRQLASLLTRGDKLGTRLAGSLHDHADRLRTARRQQATKQANKTPVKLVLPLLFCFAPAALILLIGPAMLELQHFLSPVNENSALVGNEFLNTQSIFDTLDNLNQ